MRGVARSTPSNCSLSCSPGSSSVPDSDGALSIFGSSLEGQAPGLYSARAAAGAEEHGHSTTRRSGVKDSEAPAPAPSTDASAFDAGKYLLQHKKALLQRQRVGPGRSHEMARLYNFWVSFLQDSYNEPMYNAFKRYAEEDAAAGHTHGLTCLFHFYYRYLMSQDFEDELYKDFEALALKYQDYLDFTEGMDCLLCFLASVSSARNHPNGNSSSSNNRSDGHSNSGVTTTSNNNYDNDSSSNDNVNKPASSSGTGSSGTTAPRFGHTAAPGQCEASSTDACTVASSSAATSRPCSPAATPLQLSPASVPFLTCSNGGVTTAADGPCVGMAHTLAAAAAGSSGSSGGAIAAAAMARTGSGRGGDSPEQQQQQVQDVAVGDGGDSSGSEQEDEEEELVADVLLMDSDLGTDTQTTQRLDSRTSAAPGATSPRSSSTGEAHASTIAAAAAPPTTMVLVGPGNPRSRVEVDARVLQQLHAWQQQQQRPPQPGRGADACGGGGADVAWPGAAGAYGSSSSEASSDMAGPGADAGTIMRDASSGLAPAAPGPGGRRANNRRARNGSKLAAALASAGGTGGVSALMTYLAPDAPHSGGGGSGRKSGPGSTGAPTSASASVPHSHLAGASPSRGSAGQGGKPGNGNGGGGAYGKSQRSASASGRQQARALLADAAAAVAGVVGGGPAPQASSGKGHRHAQRQQHHAQYSSSPSPMAGSSPVVSAGFAAAHNHQQQQLLQQGGGKRALRASLSVPLVQARASGRHAHAPTSSNTRGGHGTRGARSARATADGAEEAAGVAAVPWSGPLVGKGGRVLVDDVSVWEAKPCGDASTLPLSLGELFGD